MNILGKKLNLDEFRNYCRTFDFGKLKPSSLVIHHTWSPKKSEWKSEKSIMGLKNYYEGKGWSAGPHLFVAEDGIWLFTPMNEIGIHAGEGNASWSLFGRPYTGFRGPLGSKLVSYSLGIEVVGDYDIEKWTGETYKNALGAIRILMETLGIPTESLYFHRDFPSAKKSCPGYAITKDWLFAELAKKDAEGKNTQPQVAVSPFAKEAWEWFQENNFDKSLLPSQTVSAEALAVYLKKLYDLTK